jgi:uncharacterized repeat protein (TIGR01451 family)
MQTPHTLKRFRGLLLALVVIMIALAASPFSTLQTLRRVVASASLIGGERTSQRSSTDQEQEISGKPARSAQAIQVLVELNEPATQKVYDQALKSSQTSEAKARENAKAEAKKQLALVLREQDRMAEKLKATPFNATELYRVQTTINAIAIRVDSSKIDDLRKLSGVKSVQFIAEETPSRAPKSQSATAQSTAINTTQPGIPGREATVEQTSISRGGSRDGSTDSQLSLAQGTPTVQVFVEMNEEPAVMAWARALNAQSGQPKNQAMAVARIAARSQLDIIQRTQLRVSAALNSAPINSTEIYRVDRVMNGIAVMVGADKLDDIRKISGVKAVRPLEPEFLSTSTSVPFLGLPQVWNGSLGVGNLTGAGIKIGIIDTGIDYQHANFGGTGALADYQANTRTVITDTIGGNPIFPTAKVVGGTDFAGDAYTGSNAPVPDPDPMDCNGHGTHVAGIAAGFGVKADGTTYTGPFDPSAPFASLRIGPGAAPQASLYALRVFGCGGTTGLTVAAINWAIDPNGDSDFSDHLDVINMSLGSNYGTLTNTSTIASENASLAGVIVVAASGNAGDTYFITSSPGNATRAISVANSVDSGIPGAVLTVNSPAPIAGKYVASAANSFLPTPAPSPGGQTAEIVLAQDPADAAGPLTTDGCSPFTNAAAVAGKIALVDRGTCGFQIKAVNAQAAGAIGVIIANNISGDPNLIAMGGTASSQVTIPTVMISLADRNTIAAQLPGVIATLGAAHAGDTLSASSSRGPAISSPNMLKPDISAPGTSITSAQTGVTCTSAAAGCIVANASGFIPSSQPLTISGTSMATPHIAGIMALLRQQHADWSVEELKALVMNTSLHDLTIGSNGAGARYGLGRIGAGRVDPQLAVQSNVIAFNADDAGQVSLSFGDEVVDTLTKTKRVRVVNKGLTAVTYNLSFDTVVDAPGVNFSLPGGSTVTVPAGQSVTLDVQLNGTASLMDHTRDATVSPFQTPLGPTSLTTTFTNAPRHWLTEEGAYLVFKVGSVTKLRVPVYSSPRPASMMSAPSVIATGGAGSGSTTIPLSGTGVCTGTLVAGPSCTGTLPNDVVSLVTPFELQVVSPQKASLVGGGELFDIQYAGVAYNAASNLIMFGVSSYGDWTTPTQVSYSIDVDFNEDGTYDRTIFSTNTGTLSSLFGTANAFGQDVFINSVLTPPGSVSFGGAAAFVNRVSAAVADTALFNNNVMFLAATPSQLGLLTGDTTFRYRVRTCSGSNPLCSAATSAASFDSVEGPFTWNYNAQGLNFGGTNLAFDLNGASLPVTWNTANMAANGSIGALLLHHHNARGKRAEVVVLEGSQVADLQITQSATPPNPTLGQNVTLTLTAKNNGPNNATGVTVTDLMPAGLTYVSDNGGGAYVPATGVWTVGALNNGATASLQIVATLNTTGSVENLATIFSGAPVDTVPENNTSRLTVTGVRVADLALTMSVNTPNVLANNPVTYTLTVKNNGDDPAYNIKVTENFPAFPALNPTSFTASAGTYNPSTGVWNLASLGKGFSETLSFTATAPNTVGPLKNEATVVSDTSDSNGANNSASATTQVYKLGVGISDPLTCTGADSVLNVSATIDTANLIGQTVNFTAQPQIPGQLFVVSNSCAVAGATGTCSTTSSQVTLSGAITDAKITITYKVQVGNGVTQGADLCMVSNVRVGAGPTGSVTACGKANCPTIGPGTPISSSSEVSDQKAGSVLIYNIYTSSASAPSAQNTRINLTNIDPSRSAFAHIFFVDGSNCSVADSFVCMTANQTISFLASDLDPGTTGYIVVVAVDSQGCPTANNNLIGDEYVKIASGHAANLGAEAISALAGGLPFCNASSSTAQLNFDGVSYNRLPRVVALDNVASHADGNDTLLILNRIGGNLAVGASTLTSVFGVFYNDTETGVSFTFNPNACQFRSSINNNFPRITPRFDQFVPSGRSGWVKLYSSNDQGILGSAINLNTNAGSQAQAFSQGHNLHKLTLTTAASYIIPVFPPNC